MRKICITFTKTLSSARGAVRGGGVCACASFPPPAPMVTEHFDRFVSTARDWCARNRNLNSTNQRLIEN